MTAAIKVIDCDQPDLFPRDIGELPLWLFAFPHLLQSLAERLPNLKLARAVLDEVGNDRNHLRSVAIENLLKRLVLSIDGKHLGGSCRIPLRSLVCAKAIFEADRKQSDVHLVDVVLRQRTFRAWSARLISDRGPDSEFLKRAPIRNHGQQGGHHGCHEER